MIKGLYAIADKDFNPLSSIEKLVKKFLMGRCKIIQVRMKGAPKLEVSEVAKKVAGFKKDFDFTFIVNDHADIALDVGADGVHVGKNDKSVLKLREMVGDRLLIGYSSHSLKEAVEAERASADYVALGAIFPTATKGPGHPIVGIDLLKKVTATLKCPVVAIGGIKRQNVCEIFKAGASAAAMITALSGATDIIEETKWFVKAASL